jgi:hypothetical protein
MDFLVQYVPIISLKNINELSMPLSSHPPGIDKLNTTLCGSVPEFRYGKLLCYRLRQFWTTFLGQASSLCAVLAIYSLWLETFTATEIDEVFSGRQSHQMNYKIRRFGDQLHLHHQGDVKLLRILLFAYVSTALSCVYDCRHLALFRSCLQSRGILSWLSCSTLRLFSFLLI